MARTPTPPPQQARDTSRAASDTRQTHQNQQDFSRREQQRGTQRSETQTEGGLRRDDGGSYAPAPGAPDKERGDKKRPYKRAGH